MRRIGSDADKARRGSWRGTGFHTSAVRAGADVSDFAAGWLRRGCDAAQAAPAGGRGAAASYRLAGRAAGDTGTADGRRTAGNTDRYDSGPFWRVRSVWSGKYRL